ncbi:gliding-associated putative ABC transporter substrate-binding component GldG [Ekhidna lutea]|uniref:Gliding-associated putative ABC transporter substrate-binding component GldG n=1 Tax=Ekhidna lutea TaxID=447679 RepID=A0A239LZ37_EKHLU|nr:Gldg family protein [Ekhidna lutea]SNT34959.1 gliding-associated putative ABC transporter substrate-binding component GldG [Ekhidna lutea]
MKKQTIIIQLLVIIAIVVVGNILSNQLYLRLDFTEDKRYTLSDATREVLEDLEDVITVTAYFSEDLPPQLLSNRKDFEDMLIEYEQRSGGNVVYEFVNPNKDQTKEQEVQQKGIGPIMINVRENDRVEQMRAYMGAVLQMGDKKEIIPLIQPGAAMEYELTTSVKKLSISDKPKIALLQGHGEVGLSTIPQLRQQLNVLYNVENYTISEGEIIPSYYRAVIIAAPNDTIPQSHFNKLDNYLSSGGNIFVAYSNVQGDLQQGMLTTSPDIGLVKWLEDKGIKLGSDFVIDAECATITVTQRQGYFTINSQKEFPFFPRVTNFADHPMTKGLDELTFTFTSSVVPIANDSTVSISSIASTSANSGVERAPSYIDIQRRWTQNDFGMGVQSLAVAAEGVSQGFGKMVVVGNGDFFVNGEGQQARQVQSDHVNFASNAIDWLADDTGLIDLRTKGITSRPLESIEDSTKNVLKYSNVFAPILLLLIYAFIRKLRNQRKKQKWMQGNFE